MTYKGPVSSQRVVAQVKEQGGLLVLVLAIQPSERVERQLKGRAGRQGDPGETYSLVRVNDPQAVNADAGKFLQGMKFFEGAPSLTTMSIFRSAISFGRHPACQMLLRGMYWLGTEPGVCQQV